MITLENINMIVNENMHVQNIYTYIIITREDIHITIHTNIHLIIHEHIPLIMHINTHIIINKYIHILILIHTDIHKIIYEIQYIPSSFSNLLLPFMCCFKCEPFYARILVVYIVLFSVGKLYILF